MEIGGRMKTELPARKRAVIEIEWRSNDDEIGAAHIQRALASLMRYLTSEPRVVDPAISATLNAKIDDV